MTNICTLTQDDIGNTLIWNRYNNHEYHKSAGEVKKYRYTSR